MHHHTGISLQVLVPAVVCGALIAALWVGSVLHLVVGRARARRRGWP